jgi:hypothetical protein
MKDPTLTLEQVTLGVDTHPERHVAAALDERGRLLGTCTIPTTFTGFAELRRWASQYGEHGQAVARLRHDAALAGPGGRRGRRHTGAKTVASEVFEVQSDRCRSPLHHLRYRAIAEPLPLQLVMAVYPREYRSFLDAGALQIGL